MLLITKWFGSFLIEGNRIRHKILVEKDAEKIAERLARIENGEILEDEKKLAELTDEVEVIEERLSSLGRLSRTKLDEKEIFSDIEYDYELLRRALHILTSKKTSEYDECSMLMHAVDFLEDLQKSLVMMESHIKEWYGEHFPEIFYIEDDVAESILKYGKREGIMKATGKRIESMGMNLKEDDIDIIKEICRIAHECRKIEKKVNTYIEEKMKNIAPNVTSLVGPVIGSKLVSHAGGVDRLARLPASTVQMLGAEKAFFRHLKHGTKPPKHGVIFLHPLIHSSGKNVRGRIARVMASKIAIAARADASTKRFIADELKKDLDDAIDNILKKKSNKG